MVQAHLETQERAAKIRARRATRITVEETVNSPAGESDDDDDESDKGKKGSGGEPKGKGKQRGPRVITIPFQSTLSITGLNGECDQFITNAGVDITVRIPNEILVHICYL